MAIADTITSMQTHTTNAYTMLSYGTDLTGINKNLSNLSNTIFEAFLESLRDSETLYTNLPKKSGNGTQITLNDTANAPMRITLNPTAISQDGTPTPDSPQDIHTISGNNSVVVSDGNGVSQTNTIDLSTYNLGSIGNYENKFIRSDGKNLIYGENNSSSGLVATWDISQVNINGTISGSWSNLTPNINKEIPAGTYTFSTDKATNKYRKLLRLYYANNDYVSIIIGKGDTYNTFTINDKIVKYFIFIDSATTGTAINDTFTLQLEKGTTATEYTPYEKGWYYKEGIGKVVLDENNTWLQQTGYFQCTLNHNGIGGYGLCDYYGYGSAGIPNSFWMTANAFRTNDTTDTLANYKTWLSTHNLTLYYVKATTTYTKLTDTTLINQLENIYKNMLSYKGTTNISQVNNDLPFTLSVSAIEDLS